MVTLSLVWLLMEKQELWLVIAMMYLQKDHDRSLHPRTRWWRFKDFQGVTLHLAADNCKLQVSYRWQC